MADPQNAAPKPARKRRAPHKTPEFGIGALLVVVGSLLLVYGYPEAGGALLALGSAGGLAAFRPGKKAAALLLALSPLLAGCTPPGTVRADAIEGLVEHICERHDKLCSSPEAMKLVGFDPERAASYKRSSELLKKTIAEAKKGDAAAPASDAVLERADAPK